MATYVIVHGGFGGGWEWTPVARLLRGLGHEVYAPTLTGMGERCHLAATQVVGLATHVEDIVGLVEFEDLHDVVLVGASYGGLPMTSAADRVAHRVGLVVYLDALVPKDGESALNLLPSVFVEAVLAGLEEHGESWRVPVPPSLVPPAVGTTAEQRAAYRARLRDQPAMSFLEPVYLKGAVDHLPRAYVRCTRSEYGEEMGGGFVEAMAARGREGFWHYRELDATHDPHVTDPAAVARMLTELTASILDATAEPSGLIPQQQSMAERHAAWSDI